MSAIAEPLKKNKQVKHIPGKKVWTYTDYLTLEDEKRYEIIEGDLLMAPAPFFAHQDINSELISRLRAYANNHQLGKVVTAPLDVILSAENIVQPDIVFIGKDNLKIIEQHGLVGAPDMVIEIISPTSIKRDRHDKFALYEKFGVKEYWLVDPANRSVEIFNLKDEQYELTDFAAEKGAVKSQVIAGFVLQITELMPAD